MKRERIESMDLKKIIRGVLASFCHDHPEWAIPSAGWNSLAKRLNGQLRGPLRQIRKAITQEGIISVGTANDR
jgi:hypothetical protein